MADEPTPQTGHTPPQDLHWGIAYLREDIQDIRQETRQGFQDIRKEFQDVDKEFQHVRQEIQDLRQDMLQEFGQSRKSVDSRFFMLLGTMATMTGVLLAAVKL